MPTRRREDRRGRRISEVYEYAGSTNSPPRIHQSHVLAHDVSPESTPFSPDTVAARLVATTKSNSAVAKFRRKEGRGKARARHLPTKQHDASVRVVAASAEGPYTSSSSSECAPSQGEEFESYNMPSEKRRSAIELVTGIFNCWFKAKDVHGGGVDGSLFSQSRQGMSVSTKPRLSNSLSTAALIERARAQQEALLEIQDTSDMWEWHMEQQHAITNQEHEICERASTATSDDQLAGSLAAAAAAPPLLQSGGMTSPTSTEDIVDISAVMKLKTPYGEVSQGKADALGGDGGVQNIGGPCWGCGQQNEVIAGKLLQMFETALMRYRWEVNGFCRVYMQQIVRAGYSLVNTLMEMEPNTVFLRRVHANYALEAKINAALFRCFENDSFDDSGLTQIFDPAERAAARLQEFVRVRGLDPAEALRMHTATYEPGFHKFAAAKSEEVLALLPAAALAFRSAAQRDRFMDAFLRAAKWAWLLHRLATLTTPPTTIVRVGRGHPVDAIYVEAVVVPPIGSCTRCSVTALPSVEFMIMPGFVAVQPHKVLRCRVYQHFMCKQLQ